MFLELILGVSLSLAAPTLQDDVRDLPERYRIWFEEEVVYIIAGREREVFLKLTNDSQRDRFIEEFWRERDPTPGTERNEFREEHYRRIEYADKWLGRETGRPGRLTDRGRIYILLGEPRQKRSFDGDRILVPSAMWFYEASPTLGVPPHFYVIFFKKYGVGDYILYDPTIHGPESLIFLSAGENFETAAVKIADVDVELAQASLSLVPSELADYTSTIRPSLSSVMLVSQIENMPEFNRDTLYAERILRDEPRVETGYTFAAEQPASAFHVLKLGGGDSLLNYAFFFAPRDLQFGQYDERVYTALEVLVTVLDPEDRVVFNRRQALDMDFEGEDIEKLKRGGISFEDHFLIIPGKYTASLTVRNRITRVFYTVREEIEVPPYVAAELKVLQPVLYVQSQDVGHISPSSIPPFAYHTVKFHPLLSDHVPRSQEIGVFYQVSAPGFTDAGAQGVEIEYRLVGASDSADGGGQPVFASKVSLPPARFDETGTATVFANVQTEQLAPGEYALEIGAELNGEKAAARSRKFMILARRPPGEPITYYGPKLDFTGPEPVLQKANQLFNLSKADVATRLLQSALERWPSSDEVGELLAEALGKQNKIEEAVDVLIPIALRNTQDARWKIKIGTLYLQMGRYTKAVGFLEQARLLEGDSVEVLNLLGEAYRFSENKTKALEMWKKSLRINNRQPLIAGRVESIESDERNK